MSEIDSNEHREEQESEEDEEVSGNNNLFTFINSNTDELETGDVTRRIENQIKLADPDFHVKQNEPVRKSYGLTESIQLSHDGSITHYKFHKDETPADVTSHGIDPPEVTSQGVDLSEMESHGECDNDSESTVSFGEEGEAVNELRLVKMETQDDVGRDRTRPQRASAVTAKHRISVINRLIENNSKILGQPDMRYQFKEPDADQVPEDDESEEETPAPEPSRTPTKSTSTTLTRWDKIESTRDIPILTHDREVAFTVRERIAYRQPASTQPTDNTNSFRCKHCHITVSNMYILYLHIFSAHKSILPYQCVECGCYFEKAAELEAHTILHSHRATEYLYRLKPFKRADSVFYKCPLVNCIGRPMSWSMFINHLHFHWASDCLLCGEGLVPNEINSFFTHMSVHIEDGPVTCRYCPTLGFRDIMTLQQHLYTKHDAGYLSWRCRFCRQKFKSFAKFDLHMLKHHSSTPYECQYCGRELPSIISLEHHMTFHNERGEEHDKMYNRNIEKRQKPVPHVPNILRKNKKFIIQASAGSAKTQVCVQEGTSSDTASQSVGRYVKIKPSPNSGQEKFVKIRTFPNDKPENPIMKSLLPSTYTTAYKPILPAPDPSILQQTGVVLPAQTGPGLPGQAGQKQLVHLVPVQQNKKFLIIKNKQDGQVTVLNHLGPFQQTPDGKILIRATDLPAATSTAAPAISTPSTVQLADDSLNLKITDVRGATDIPQFDKIKKEESETSPIVIEPISDSPNKSDSSGKRSEKPTDLKVCPFPHCLAVFSSVTDMWTNHYRCKHYDRGDSHEFMCMGCGSLYVNNNWPPASHSCKNPQWIHICSDCGLLFENQRQKQQHYIQCKGFLPEEAVVQAGSIVDPLTCKYCQVTSDCVRTLCDHMMKHHASMRFYSPLIACELCPEMKRFLKVDHLWTHYELAHPEYWSNIGRWLCRICGADHTTVQEMDDHLVYSHGRYVAPFLYCAICSSMLSAYKTRGFLEQHMRVAHNSTVDGRPLHTRRITSQHQGATVIAPHLDDSTKDDNLSSEILKEGNVDQTASKSDDVDFSGSMKISVEDVGVDPSRGSHESDSYTNIKTNNGLTINEKGAEEKGSENGREVMEKDKDGSGETEGVTLYICEVCAEMHESFESLKDHVRLDHERQTILLTCPCPDQPPLSIRRWVHRFWQHLVHVHTDWLLSFKFTCSVCGELFNTRKEFEMHEVYRHKTDVNCITIRQCLEIVKNMEGLRPKKRASDTNFKGTPVTDEQSSKESPVIDEQSSKESPVTDEQSSKESPATGQQSSKESPATSQKEEPAPVKGDVITLSSSEDEDESSCHRSVDGSETSDTKNTAETDHDRNKLTDEYKCDHCGKSLPDEASLRKHEKLVHPVGHIKCERCKGRMPVDAINSHICPADQEVLAFFPCNFCSDKLATVAEKNKHIATKHREQLKRCSLCKKAFINDDTLTKHMERMHPAKTVKPQPPKVTEEPRKIPGKKSYDTSYSSVEPRNIPAKTSSESFESIVPSSHPVPDSYTTKGKRGRPLGSKNKPKDPNNPTYKPPGKRGRKKGSRLTVKELLDGKKGSDLGLEDSLVGQRKKREGPTVHKFYSGKCNICGRYSSWGNDKHVCQMRPDSDGDTSRTKARDEESPQSSRCGLDIARPGTGSTEVITITAPNIAGSDSMLEQDMVDMLDYSDDEDDEEEEEGEEEGPEEEGTSEQVDLPEQPAVDQGIESDGEAAPGADNSCILALHRGGDSSDDEDNYTEVRVNTGDTSPRSNSPQTGDNGSNRKRHNSAEIFDSGKSKYDLLDQVFGPKRAKADEAAERVALEEAIFGPKTTPQAVIDEVFGPERPESPGASSKPADTCPSSSGATNTDFYSTPMTSQNYMEITPEPDYQSTQEPVTIQPLMITPTASPPTDYQPVSIEPVEDPLVLEPADYRCEVCGDSFPLECYLDIHRLNAQHF